MEPVPRPSNGVMFAAVTGVVFHRPLLDGEIGLPQVVDARIHLRDLPRVQKIWNRNGRQQSDDRDDDHDFDESEARRAGGWFFHGNGFPSRSRRSANRFYCLVGSRPPFSRLAITFRKARPGSQSR